jgi:hypothetical protein
MDMTCQIANYEIVDGNAVRFSEVCGKPAYRLFKGKLCDVPVCQDHEEVWRLLHAAIGLPTSD